MLFIGADHAGFKLKAFIKKYLMKEGISFADIGALKEVPDDDYPDFALKLSKSVAKNKGSRGILICGTGVGMCMAANKVKGIRAANVYDEYTAKFSKLHNDANVICLRGWEVDPKKSLELLKIWLNTKFDGDKRLVRRINKIKRIERAFFPHKEPSGSSVPLGHSPFKGSQKKTSEKLLPSAAKKE